MNDFEFIKDAFATLGVFTSIVGVIAAIYFGLSNLKSKTPALKIVIANYVTIHRETGLSVTIQNPRNFELWISEVSFGLDRKHNLILPYIYQDLPRKIGARQCVNLLIPDDDNNVRERCYCVIVGTQCGYKFTKRIPRKFRV